MNNLSQNPVSSKPVILSKIDQLNGQNSELNDAISNDINTLLNRISSIGSRLNATNHPDNVPTCVDGAKKEAYPEMTTTPVSGIEGELINVIDRNGVFIGNWHNNFYPAFNKYLNYIEGHI